MSQPKLTAGQYFLSFYTIFPTFATATSWGVAKVRWSAPPQEQAGSV